MPTYAISDLHVHREDQPYLFTPTKEAFFDRLAEDCLASGAALVIAGDFIDFTGMANPPRGHAEFFAELFPGAVAKSHPLVLEALRSDGPFEQLADVAQRYPILFRRLGELARANLLTLIPGNHDCCLRDPKLQSAFAARIGAPSGAVRWVAETRVGDVAFAAHGNDFDPSNRTAGGCHNRGIAVTSALYRALMPALILMGVPRAIVHAIPAVRPEELVLRGIAQYVGEARAHRLIAAFVGLLARNGFFPTWQKWLLLPVSHRIPWFSERARSYLTPDRLIASLPEESYMKEHVRAEAERLQSTLSPPARVVVLGHTHERDQTPHYVNLGTWIDHLTGISLAHLESADTELPVLRIGDDGSLAMHDARDLGKVSSLERCRILE